MNSPDQPSALRERSISVTMRPVREFFYHLAIAVTALTLLALAVWLCRTWLVQSSRYLDPARSGPAQEDLP